MIVHSVTQVHKKAAVVRHTLSCLQEGVRRARAEKRKRLEAERNAGLQANTEARWY